MKVKRIHIDAQITLISQINIHDRVGLARDDIQRGLRNRIYFEVYASIADRILDNVLDKYFPRRG